MILLIYKGDIMTDIWYDIITLFVAILIIATPCSIMGYIGDKVTCQATAKALGYTPYYTILTGCVVEKPNGTRVLLDQIRNVGISKEQ